MRSADRVSSSTWAVLKLHSLYMRLTPVKHRVTERFCGLESYVTETIVVSVDQLAL